MAKRLLRFLNRLLTLAVGIVLATATLYAGYALWDNWQIVRAADNPLAGMTPAMAEPLPEAEGTAPPEKGGEESAAAEAGAETAAPEGETPTGEETREEMTELEKLFISLKDINPDIGAWITVPGTNINYPVVRGKNNIEYISRDIYRNFAIVGSIFLDSRNKEDYTDTYNLLYGHNMTEHRMFSDVNLFKDEKFFNENQKAYIYFPTGAHWLQSVSIILTNAGDSWMMNPRSWDGVSGEKLTELVRQNALFVSEEGIEALKATLDMERQPVFVALSTCSNEFTDARTILLTLMDPPEDAGDDE